MRAAGRWDGGFARARRSAMSRLSSHDASVSLRQVGETLRGPQHFVCPVGSGCWISASTKVLTVATTPGTF
jgi:hypothetical protein